MVTLKAMNWSKTKNLMKICNDLFLQPCDAPATKTNINNRGWKSLNKVKPNFYLIPPACEEVEGLGTMADTMVEHSAVVKGWCLPSLICIASGSSSDTNMNYLLDDPHPLPCPMKSLMAMSTMK